MRRIVQFQLGLCLVGLAAGLSGFWLARDFDLAGRQGGQVGFRSYELNLMTYNRLGALVTIALSAIGLVGVFTLKPPLGVIPATGFALLALQVLIQWRPDADNVFASSGTNLSFSLMMALGFGVTAWLSRLEPYRSEPIPDR